MAEGQNCVYSQLFAKWEAKPNPIIASCIYAFSHAFVNVFFEMSYKNYLECLKLPFYNAFVALEDNKLCWYYQSV